MARRFLIQTPPVRADAVSRATAAPKGPEISRHTVVLAHQGKSKASSNLLLQPTEVRELLV